MSEEIIYQLLSGLGYPVAYDHFDKPVTSRPFILYRNADVESFKADDINYFKPHNYEINLITDKKDIIVENRLETLLTDNHLPFNKDEDFIESEKIYQITYEI